MTRQKEAETLWDLLKHEKELLDWCKLSDIDDSELSLHHEFNPSSRKIGYDRARTILDYD